MNNGELKQRLRDYSHRTDLDPYLQGFINDAGQRINNRFGLKLGDLFEDVDTNTILGSHHLLYFYDAMRSLNIFIKAYEEAVRFDELWDKEASRMNIHNRQDSWVTDSTALTYVRNEDETEALLNAN